MRDRRRRHRWLHRPAHEMAGAASVEKAEDVEAAISLVRPTSRPGRGLAPFSKRRRVRMGRGEAFHGAWIRLTGRRVDILSKRQFVEIARIGDDENWRIVHPAPPFLAVGRDDADGHAFNPSHNIGSIRVPDRYGEPADLNTGLYCETVMKSRQPLLVPDALSDEAWKCNPDIKLGMISYLRVPITWPDGETFGTICVLANKANEYSDLYLRLLLQWRDVVEADLTSLATLHSKLEERDAKVRRLFDANIIGIFIWELEGQITEANDAFLQMLGYDREDLVCGRLRWTDLTPPEWFDLDIRRWIPELKTTGSLQPFEKEYFRKDGGRIPVLIGVASFEKSGNQGVAFVLDLTERKRAEAEARESERRYREVQMD